MMSYKIVIPFLIAFIGAYHQNAKAQTLPISGDTIYVSSKSQIQIDFPSIPKDFTTNPNNSAFRIKKIGRGINITAGPENGGTATLLVSEAARYHRFVIVFKKNTNKNHESEEYYDYSTEEKLEGHIRKLAPPESGGSQNSDVKLLLAAQPVNSSFDYFALLKKGDQYLQEQNYQEAKSSFEKAHNLRPEEIVPIQRLEVIRIKLANNEKAMPQKIDNSYSVIIAGAINYLDQQKYTEAKELYKQALNARPGDLYATQQLETINKLLLEAGPPKEQAKLNDPYNEYISQGQKAFSKNQFKEARIAYEQALAVRQNDSVAANALKSIGEKENIQKQSEALENNYKAAIGAADKLYELADYNNAKKAYNKAVTIIKKTYPQEQVKKIDKLLNEQALKENIEKQQLEQQIASDRVEKAKRALEDNYAATLQVADNFFKKGDYTDAKAAYNEAINLIKKAYPQEQVKKIDKLISEQTIKENLEKQHLAQQLAADSLRKERQALDEKYSAAVQLADNYYQKGDFAKAKTAYNGAISLIKMPYPQEQVKKIDKLISEKIVRENLEKQRLQEQMAAERLEKEKQALEKNYAAALQVADDYFNKSDYANAKIAYSGAIDIIKRPYPQEQIKKIDNLVSEQVVKENIEKQKLAQQIAVEKLDNEKRALEDNYAAAVQSADSFFKKGDYTHAKIAYGKALDVVARDWPRKQIDEINKIIADQVSLENAKREEKKQQELENEYSAEMQSADKFFDAGDYDNAKIAYNKAISIIPKSLPQEKIKKIDKIQGEQLAQATAEKRRKTQEAEITSRYATLIKNAAQEFDKSNYVKAKKLYADASNLKPEEGHPKESLHIIENILTRIEPGTIYTLDSIRQPADINKKYAQALSKGKSFLQKNDLMNAEVFYEEAMNIKLNEEEPKIQLNIIRDRLANLDRQTEIDSNYERKITLADSQLIEKAYDSAIIFYREAASIKPEETYPKLQIKFVKSEKIERDKANAIIKRQEDERRYRELLAIAEKLVTDKRFREAKTAYIESLTIHPESEYAQSRFRIVSYQVERARAGKQKLLRVDTVEQKPPPIVKSKKKNKKDKNVVVIAKPDTLTFQAIPIPYGNEELKNKYPNINFSTSPPEQTFNKSVIYSKEDPRIYDTLLLKKAILDSSSMNGGIKLICQGINFGETIVAIKLLVQNYSAADFLTGAMMLTRVTKTGAIVKMEPYNLLPSPLPVIKARNEAVVVYVCKSYDISDDETLNFHLADRLNKVELQVRIPGSVYNREWAR